MAPEDITFEIGVLVDERGEISPSIEHKMRASVDKLDRVPLPDQLFHGFYSAPSRALAEAAGFS